MAVNFIPNLGAYGGVLHGKEADIQLISKEETNFKGETNTHNDIKGEFHDNIKFYAFKNMLDNSVTFQMFDKNDEITTALYFDRNGKLIRVDEPDDKTGYKNIFNRLA